MYKQAIDEKRKALDEAIGHYVVEVGKVRTGRANPAVVENLMVDYYGTRTPLKQIASITAPEARLIMIQPWDKGSLVYIESAIRESDLGLNPSNDGQVVRIAIPPLNEERRVELVKFLNKKTEESKVAVRTIREDLWKRIQEMEKEGSIAEDDKFQGKEYLQKVVDEYNTKLEELRAKKEKDIMTV
ncbi:ribosome recycling factor [Patescibacteria group bacterium]|nr:MAG: ribosome recycling factor [Patescibacteria group bacterium]